jgi:NADH-quinone oxidoreductase subunit H
LPTKCRCSWRSFPPAILAGSWSITGVAAFYAARPLYSLINIPAFAVALLSLARASWSARPLTPPEAETEIVGGALVEYSGRHLAFFFFLSACGGQRLN